MKKGIRFFAGLLVGLGIVVAPLALSDRVNTKRDEIGPRQAAATPAWGKFGLDCTEGERWQVAHMDYSPTDLTGRFPTPELAWVNYTRHSLPSFAATLARQETYEGVKPEGILEGRVLVFERGSRPVTRAVLMKNVAGWTLDNFVACVNALVGQSE